MVTQTRDFFRRLRGGYPGGWRQHAQGSYGSEGRHAFEPARDPSDIRSQIPPLGLREYWYPALPVSAVSAKKPTGFRLLGEDLALFRDADGEVKALGDVCPHRGVRLSVGSCYFKGFLTCNYHGATFDGNGECVEFLPEGPDSKMVGKLQARVFPTVTLKGVVFVWMGEREPVPPQEDIPPEFFDDHTMTKYAWTYWECNWMVSWENTLDAHNQFFVHRDSVRMLLRRNAGRTRTPLGPRARILDGKTVHPERDVVGGLSSHGHYRDKETGKVPHQLYHPRVQGYWPQHRYRLAWTWASEWLQAKRKKMTAQYECEDAWIGQRLPCLVRNRHWDTMYTRWAIPVDDNLTRVVYMLSARPRTGIGRLWQHLRYPVYNWAVHFNFSNQDYGAMESTRYSHPENLSATDSYLASMRRLIVEHGRKPPVREAQTPPAGGAAPLGAAPAGDAVGDPR
jgi:phenylpropionate dioxygenase-like ring-hydroxylating dioxygenase large terminal subunit